jgi:hypothetical protein
MISCCGCSIVLGALMKGIWIGIVIKKIWCGKDFTSPLKRKIKRKKKSLCKRAAVTKQSWTVGMNNKVRLVGSLCHIKEQFLYLAGEKLRYLKTFSYYIIHIYYTI